MKINTDNSNLNSANINRATLQQPHTSEVSGTKSEPAAEEDTATLPLDNENTKALIAKALSFPETRQDKIEALRRAITSGEYRIEPDKVAEAILHESLTVKPKK
jgi:negative regulator of flagellin synthesis FlgM